MYDKITADTIRKQFSAIADNDIEIYDSVDSTNTVAAERAKSGCSEWHTVIAHSQSGGHGRLGRSFFSPADTGAYMSIVLYPDESKRELITGCAAVAVCEALENYFDLSPHIKWVNDIFINGRKVCGILAKGLVLKDRFAVILGIGVNVFCPDGGFPEEISNTAGYLFDNDSGEIKSKVCGAILESLKKRYDSIGADDAPECYRKRCITTGRSVTVIPAGKAEDVREAYALDVTDGYHLRVQYADGTCKELSSGEVSVKL